METVQKEMDEIKELRDISKPKFRRRDTPREPPNLLGFSLVVSDYFGQPFSDL